MKKCPRCGKEFQDANTLCPADGAVLQREDELVGETLSGKYRIEEKISEGGMGCVYRATHVLMEKTVAIKVLHPALAADDKIVARFTREARAASRISHPHAIVVTDFGESENGVVFLVMEYLRGRTLKDVIRSEGPLPLPRVTEIIRQVSGALDAAHAEGVVHRDLKSDNIMLDETAGGGDWAKVLDFGIAKITEKTEGYDQGLTAPNLIIGTPQYMSPEQCSQAANIDARSDIYSLGVILFEMLAGHVPFSGESPTETMMMHMQEPAPSLMGDRADLPASVDLVVQRAMSKQAEDRFQSAGELSDALMLTASEEAVVSAGAAGGVTTDGQSAPGTNRIVVPTGENESPRATGSQDVDEATVVSARNTRTGEHYHSGPTPPPASSFNPWRIAIPAIVLLAVVFGLFYLFQDRGQSEGSSDTGASQNRPATSDPGGRPVVSTSPPTGAGERNIPSGSGISGSASDSINGGLPSNTDAGTGEESIPTEGEGDDAGEETAPTPEGNTNRRVAPAPPRPSTNTDVRPPSTPESTPPPPSSVAPPVTVNPDP